MRRSTSVWTAGAVVVGLTASVALAQQYADNGSDPAPTATSDAPRESSDMPLGGSGMETAFAGRDARYLLRNGLDYLNYGEYARALTYLRAVEDRQKNKDARNELNDSDRKLLRSGIAKAQAGLREAVNSPNARGRMAAARSRASNQAGALALATPSGDAPRDPATRTASTGATTLPDGSPLPQLPDIPPVPAPSKPKAEDARPAAKPEAAAAQPMPAELPPIGPAPADGPKADPVKLDPAKAEAPKADPKPEPAKEVLTLETIPTSAELPLPMPRPEGPKPPVQIPSNDPAPTPEPAAPAPIPEPSGLAPSALPEPAPAPLPSAPVISPEPAPAPRPEAPKTEALAPLPSAPAVGAPARPELATAPTPAPAPTPEPAPAPKPEPAKPEPAKPEPAASPAVAELPQLPSSPAPAPAPAETVQPQQPAPLTAEAPPSNRPEPSRPLPETPPAASEPPPAAEAESLPPLPGDQKTPARGTSELFNPDRSEYRSLLSDKAREEVLRIAQRQDEEARRLAQQPGTPAGTSPAAPTMPLGDTSALINQPGQGSTRFELPRAPSPTEARPLRSIPVPEDFVPLEARQWDATRKMWAAAAVCHTPLYFQDAVLERYGQSTEQLFGPAGRFLTYPLDDPRQSKQRNQIIQPFFSVGLFAAQIVALPYNMIVDPPWESQYEHGYYRPGDRIPPDTFYLPLHGVGPPLRGKKY